METTRSERMSQRTNERTSDSQKIYVLLGMLFLSVCVHFSPSSFLFNLHNVCMVSNNRFRPFLKQTHVRLGSSYSLTHSLYRSGVHSEKEKEKERPGTCVWELWLINAYEKLRSSYLHKGANKAAYSAFCPINCYYRRLIFFSKLK